MATETLHFKIGLAGTYWDKRPQFSIAVGKQQVEVAQEVTAPSGEVFFVEFTAELEEGSVDLEISLDNKTNSDVVKDNYETEDFVIINDMLLNIRSIEIDEINLGNLLYSKSEFVSENPDRPTLNNCIDLGWNGTWRLTFESPYYIWLLSNI
jgi:hypothetical protein